MGRRNAVVGVAFEDGGGGCGCGGADEGVHGTAGGGAGATSVGYFRNGGVHFGFIGVKIFVASTGVSC